jgi:hypothetical protein
VDNDKLLVTVVGLLPVQANRVQADFGDKVDLKFIRSDTTAQKIAATAESSDYVILMTKFISHEIQSALRKHDGLNYCNGGITAVGLKLDQLLER